MAAKKATPSRATSKPATPAVAGPPDEHFDEADTLPAAPSEPAPKKSRKAKATRERPGLADAIGNPKDVDLGAENVTKIGTAPDARGKKQAVEEGEGGEAEENE